jgi:hypothetical protein
MKVYHKIPIVRQLLINKINKLLNDTLHILEEKKQKTPDHSSEKFRDLLLSAPTISDEQYHTFLENRKMFNKWRGK